MKTILSLLMFACIFAVASSGHAYQDSTAEKKEIAEPTLYIGSDAPSLNISDWVSKGDFEEVTDFEPGKVYVVEFWATWCPPCKAAMPHISELQTEYADQGVQIISVSSEDLETVQEFLEEKVKGDADKTYGELTANYCLTTDPDNSVKNDYLRAAKIDGIPMAFIVGKTGKIEWIGHPTRIGKPLRQVVEDNWDREEAKADRAMVGIDEAVMDDDLESAIQQFDAAIARTTGEPQERLKVVKYQVMEKGGMEGADAEFTKLADEATSKFMKSELTWSVAKLK